MQIEHDVGVDRQRQQRFLQRVRVADRFPARDGGACLFTDRHDVRGGVLPEPARQRVLQFIGNVAEAPVEIDARRQVEAAERRAVHELRQPDGIRGRHEDHFAVDAAGGVEAFEFAPQHVRHEHRGHLVRVQRSLDIDLLAAAGGAVVVRREPVVGGARFGGDRMGRRMHMPCLLASLAAADYV
jgi:hypothetical protein